MSRSRKKTPSYSDYSRSHTRWAKRQASKTVRRYKKSITDGGLYKKIFPTYNIFDYKGYWNLFKDTNNKHFEKFKRNAYKK